MTQMLNFPSMDPEKRNEQAEYRTLKDESRWKDKAERDKLDADKKAAWHRYQEYVKRQGGVDVASLPWNSENWYEKFTEWESK